MMSSRGSLIVIALFFGALQVLVLPSDGFVTGDQGSKFLQARAFAENGPLNPSIDVQSRDIDPQYLRQEPKLKERRGRLVSEFLWLLPLVSAPFVRILGMRGLYVVPTLSVVAVFLAASALGRRIGDDRGLWTAWVVLLVTPVAIYGLEFWEHSPATACLIVAAVLLAPSANAQRGEGGYVGSLKFAAAGAVIAIGALFREEAIVALPALLAGRSTGVKHDRLKDLVNAAMWTTLGAGLVLASSAPVNLMIYGAALPMHMTQDAWQVARSLPYLQVRRDVLVDLLLPSSYPVLFVAALMSGLAAASTQAWRRRAGRADHPVSRALVVIVHSSIAIVLAIAVVHSLWALARGVRPHEAYRVTSAVHTWPFVLALLYWPWVATESQRPVARYLVVTAVLVVVGTALVVPTSGGTQWSPRFLLPAAPLLAVVAAAAARPMPNDRLRTFAGGITGSAAIAWMTRAILVASFVMQLTGLVWVQRAKTRNARLTHEAASMTAPGDVLISNVFWFPEVTATLASSRRMLFSWSSSDIPAMASAAARHGFKRFSVVTSMPLTGYEAPQALDLPGVRCRFTRGAQIALDELGLVLNPYACEER